MYLLYLRNFLRMDDQVTAYKYVALAVTKCMDAFCVAASAGNIPFCFLSIARTTKFPN